jgi:glycosyltransferase involved in cell wall biosynthesis
MESQISLCMIVKDEEKILENFLAPIKDLVDEIIIIDTGSLDKTKEIAKKFTDKVYEFKWQNDFSKARNFSISKATKEWILVLDPDEKIEKEDIIKLKEILTQQKSLTINKGGRVGPIIPPKESKVPTLGFRLIQKTYYKNKIISIRGITRVFKNNKKIKFIYPIHETVREPIKNLKAKIGRTGIVIKHYPKLNKEKQKYYLKLLKTKKKNFPDSSVDKEIENEYELFNY